MEEDGELPQFNPNNIRHILLKAEDDGWKNLIMIGAIDLVRENPKLTNSEAIFKMAKKYKVI